MKMTFITTLKVLVRDRSVMLWTIAFPLVLTTLFVFMFSNLDETYRLKPIPVVIVADANYLEADNFIEMIEALATADSSADADASPLLAPSFADSQAAALSALETGMYKGYILIDADGLPTYFMDPRRPDIIGDPSQTILLNILDLYVQNSTLITNLIENQPELLADPGFFERLNNVLADDGSILTQHISVTRNPTSDALRYYYAVLAFSSIMMSGFALTAIDMVLGNTSPLGARRSIGGQSKLKTLIPTIAAAWLLGLACVLIGFCYLRFVFNIGFGGKEAFVVLTLAVSVLAATFLGTFLGSLPIVSGAKSGMIALISCVLSLFAGLYGPFSQDLGDLVAHNYPLASGANPVRQVADALFSLYYYDGYAQLAAHLVNLLVISGVLFIISVFMLRRQRYASL